MSKILVTAATETDAVNGALREAEEKCEGFTVISGPESTFQGKEEKEGEGLAGAAVSIAKLGFGTSEDHSKDWKSVMVIQCPKP